VEQSLGVAPAELSLYFLRPGVEYQFSWDDNARRQAVEMVNAAIQEIIDDPLHSASSL
jgi:hypothetical protein